MVFEGYFYYLYSIKLEHSLHLVSIGMQLVPDDMAGTFYLQILYLNIYLFLMEQTGLSLYDKVAKDLRVNFLT